MMANLAADRTELIRFTSALFRYADANTFAALRGFDQVSRRGPARLVEAVKITDDLSDLAERAALAAERCADTDEPAVFAPPICTFSNSGRARGEDLANGLALSVELDEGDSGAARRKLEGLLGPATVVVASGGEWTHPDTGEIFPKLHIHWRLSEPTREQDDHHRLRQARDMACTLVGADPTGKPVVHPLRWPGSWNLKGKPKMACIVAYDDARELHLLDAVDALATAIEAEGMQAAEMAPQSGDPTAPLFRLTGAMAMIPNPGVDVHYDDWIKYGYALFRASGGSDAGYDIWDAWSRKSDKYNAGEQEAAWKRIGAAIRGSTAPRTIGAGTIFFQASRHGWVRDVVTDMPARASLEDATEPQNVPGFPLVWFDDIQVAVDVNDFVQGLLVTGAASVLYGESNSGKTFLATDLALCVAAGIPWNGKRVEQGGVIYIAMEGGQGFRNRVFAWKTDHDTLATPVYFAAIQSSVNLLNPEADLEKLIITVRAAAKQIPVPVKLIVVDTLSRALAGGNENSPEDMGALVMNVDHLRAQTGSHVLAIHHSGKDAAKGARGHSLLRAAIDTEIEVVDMEGNRTATVVKQRDLAKGDVHQFTLNVVELTTNRHGEPVTTCLVKFADSLAPVAQQHRRLPQSQQRAISVLTDLIAAEGQTGHAGTPSGIPSVPEGWWRERYYDRAMPGAETKAKEKAFRRAADALVSSRLVGMGAKRVWLVYGAAERAEGAEHVSE